MSTALAVAAVTQALKNLLVDGVLDAGQVGDVRVTALPPDRVAIDGTDAHSQINLFLYQVTENAAWRNMGLPSFSAAGERISNPPLALDLHYLLMAYGVKELHSEILLGYAMQILHDTPQLSRDGLREALKGINAAPPPPPPPAVPDIPNHLSALALSNLAEQFELVKFSPEVLSTEEISRLWTAFGAKYRTSAAYVASCVLIQSTVATRATRPVVRRNLEVVQFLRPTIDDVQPSMLAAGEMLTLSGSQLWQPAATHVRLSSVEVPIQPGATSLQLQMLVPHTLRAGINTASVNQGVSFKDKDPAVGERPGPQSNTVAFMLIPKLANVPNSAQQGALVTVDVNPPVGFDQDVQILLGDTALVVPPRPAPPVGTATTTSITFTVPKTAATGKVPLRIRVDGAESKLDPLTMLEIKS
ncbi:DUF4255 domain-containing protein [Paraburkholderia rhizosphaerae]|uniref:Uncharacterized protein DUF4255 n=1 Tax=Paraburkholderia rhizosphaerae TaxID=480658 RepID=A0A4R8LTI6_9BURK|nr:DUF4255 domain-containing protein [Paraburkholderia rhizosphaerae]TDY50914.1 uncharacterized protein DUF4255 [Paraburkholderia rhizosphaerae]